jgi:multidrug resistance efflux pump
LELRSEVQALKSQLTKRIENEHKAEKEIKRLEKELDAERVKFSHLDRSTISMASVDTELTQQEVFRSPQNNKDSSFSPSSDLKNMPSPAS